MSGKKGAPGQFKVNCALFMRLSIVEESCWFTKSDADSYMRKHAQSMVLKILSTLVDQRKLDAVEHVGPTGGNFMMYKKAASPISQRSWRQHTNSSIGIADKRLGLR
jgi:hypothetical protein